MRFWWVFRLQKLYIEKRLVSKLVEECNETIDKEVEIIDNNTNKCNSCIKYIVLFSIFLTINTGIGAYFAYYKYVNLNEKNISRYDYVYQTTIY